MMAMDEGEWISVRDGIRQRAKATAEPHTLPGGTAAGWDLFHQTGTDRRKGDDIEGEPQRLPGVSAIHDKHFVYFPFFFLSCF